MREPLTAPITWTSDDPHLSGNFAPIGTEIDAPDLRDIAGKIPEGLKGAYMRNGPNPRLQPVSYTYPLEGDGMLHAMFFGNGRARYRDRFVRTASFEVEDKAGHTVFGGLMNPTPADPKALGDAPPYKSSAFIGVMRHGDHLLALGEVEPAWEIAPDLDALGPWTAGTGRPLELGAHNRVHPVTGDLFALAYNPTSPTVTIHHIDPPGRRKRGFPMALAAPSMIHDFVLTETRLVLVIGPAVFDMTAAAQGQPFSRWRPALGTRIAVMDLDGGNIHWIETEACFVFHFANGFDRGAEIVIDYVRHRALSLGYGGGAHVPPRLHRLIIDPAGGTVTDVPLFGRSVELPRIDNRLIASLSRYVYIPTITDSLRIANPASATFNCLVKVDTETGSTTRHDFGDHIAGGVHTGQRGRRCRLARDLPLRPETGARDLALLDAARIEEEPDAVIRLPRRVPRGPHEAWFPG